MSAPSFRSARSRSAGAPALALLALLAQPVLAPAAAAAEIPATLERLVRPGAQAQPVVAHTALGVVACGVGIGALVARRRRRERERRLAAARQRVRAPQVFQAALVARPLRRSEAPARGPATYAAPAAPPSGTATPGPVSAEVAARAAALRAASVREAAQRAALLRAAGARTAAARAPAPPARESAPVAAAAAQPTAKPATPPFRLPAAAPARAHEPEPTPERERVVPARVESLRAASERSEVRRRAAALRAIERREREAAATLSLATHAAAIPLLASAAPRSEPTPTSPRLEPEPALAPPSLELAPEPAPSPASPAVEPEPVHAPPAAARTAPIPPAAAPVAPAAAPPAEAPHAGPRVAILHASGALTFEWLESCLARDPEDLQARLDLCTALLVAERCEDAERIAREGLDREPENGRLLLRLSEALCGQDRIDEALDAGLRAVRTHRSRKAVLHLTRLSALARRFGPGDGPRLRKALEGRPQDPVLLHAVGVFESMHGSPRRALALLRLALRHEKSARFRRLVSREVARLRAEEIAGGSLPGAAPRRAAS
jgi:thioredoxin-like negative regulator of GroEL